MSLYSSNDPILNDPPKEEGEGTETSRYGLFSILHAILLGVAFFALNEFVVVSRWGLMGINLAVLLLTIVLVMTSHKPKLHRKGRLAYAIYFATLNFLITTLPILVGVWNRMSIKSLIVLLVYEIVVYGSSIGVSLVYKR